MRIDVRVSLVDEDGERFMGAGLVWLLEGIRVHGSISEAARAMGLSYAKAHRILKRLEDRLSARVLTRHAGGNGRGGADLTPLGSAFLDHYEQLHRRIKTRANQEFSDFAAAWGEARARFAPDAPDGPRREEQARAATQGPGGRRTARGATP